MPDYLDLLAQNAMRLVKERYYATNLERAAPAISLKESILECRNTPILSEIKFASPSTRNLTKEHDLKRIAKDMEDGGAVGISILAEPRHFGGHIGYVAEVRGQVDVPVLMKDIVLSAVQIEAAYETGADAVLLIQALFDRGYCEEGIQGMIEYSHSRRLEVLLEAHTEGEFLSALGTDADMIGINNRNLETLDLDLGVTRRILAKCDAGERVVVSESGIESPEDVRFLGQCGAQAFLVGTAIMRSGNIKRKVKELVEAL